MILVFTSMWCDLTWEANKNDSQHIKSYYFSVMVPSDISRFSWEFLLDKIQDNSVQKSGEICWWPKSERYCCPTFRRHPPTLAKLSSAPQTLPTTSLTAVNVTLPFGAERCDFIALKFYIFTNLHHYTPANVNTHAKILICCKQRWPKNLVWLKVLAQEPSCSDKLSLVQWRLPPPQQKIIQICVPIGPWWRFELRYIWHIRHIWYEVKWSYELTYLIYTTGLPPSHAGFSKQNLTVARCIHAHFYRITQDLMHFGYFLFQCGAFMLNLEPCNSCQQQG